MSEYSFLPDLPIMKMKRWKLILYSLDEHNVLMKT